MDEVQQIIEKYNSVIKNVEAKALSSQERAYGGVIRSEKGKLVEEISRLIITASKQRYPDINFVLIQLESQLGGDYSKLPAKPLGSPSTHTLLSYFDVDLKIITLLKEERDIKKPIHKFFKPLTKKSLNAAIKTIAEVLKRWAIQTGK